MLDALAAVYIVSGSSPVSRIDAKPTIFAVGNASIGDKLYWNFPQGLSALPEEPAWASLDSSYLIEVPFRRWERHRGDL